MKTPNSEENPTEEPKEDGKKNQIHSKIIATLVMSVIGIGFLSVMTLANSNATSSGDKPSTTIIDYVVAKGVAVSTVNSTTDVNLIRTVIAQVGNRTFGLLQFDDGVYKLQNITFGNTTVTADIFSRELNQTVGSLSLQMQSMTNEFKDSWTGTITLNGTTYNVYAVQANMAHAFRHFRDDVSEKVHDMFQSQNHENEATEDSSE